MSATEAQQSAMKVSLITVLRHPYTQDIDFHCNQIHVDFQGLSYVYAAIVTGSAKVDIDRRLSSDRMQYDPFKNTFVFNSSTFGDPNAAFIERALLLHESVHAMVDLNYIDMRSYCAGQTTDYWRPFLTYRKNEVVAYVAQALFLTANGANNAYEFTDILTVATRIAARIHDTPGADVTDAESAELEVAIASDPIYANKPFWATANG